MEHLASEEPMREVEIVLPTESPPRLLRGEIASRRDGRLVVRVAAEAPRPGQQVIVVPPDGARVVGAFEGTEGGAWVIATRRRVPRDKRLYPRMWAGLRLQWKVAEPGEAERWRAGEPVGGTWRQPDPFMDFSAAGLRFRSDPACRQGDTLLLDLLVPGHPAPLRAVGRVVRVFEVPEEEREDAEGTHYVAIAFEDLAPEVARALADFTLRLQDAITG